MQVDLGLLRIAALDGRHFRQSTTFVMERQMRANVIVSLTIA